jgi:Amt family ammonium transporter
MSSLAELQTEVANMKANYDEALDTIWMLLAGLLVFFMHAGFSLLEAGSVRFKNTQNILSKNLLVVTIGFLCWWATGWSFAYGAVEDPGKFIGSTQWFMDGFWDDKTLFRNWFFQGAFCATACTIVSGAMAERTQLKGLGTYAIILTAFIYPAIAYWGWSGSGFLAYTNDDGETVSSFGSWYKDFAGSGIVHLTGGVGALVGSICVGPRKGRFDDPASEDEFEPANIPFIVLGTFALWFGWYGFNPGSTLSMHDKGTAHTAGLVAVNTTLAPCIAGLLVFVSRATVLPPRKLHVGGFCNGILAGLVSITAGCAFVKPWEAVIIGFIGAFAYMGASALLKIVKVDDVVEAFPVHGACGMWGVLAVGLFGNEEDGAGGNGLFYGGDQLRVQIMGVLMIILWAGGLSLIVLAPLRLAGCLRLTDEFQDEGADAREHSPKRASWTGQDTAKLFESPEKSPPAKEIAVICDV